ncbi:glycerate kinase-like isoform X1 [Mytilus edulis]|uniref:glycerate kinase-like isoform X1 n=2 Tax=Mytilus edulis TaxID=6550 RepID=UPI0039EF32F3
MTRYISWLCPVCKFISQSRQPRVLKHLPVNGWTFNFYKYSSYISCVRRKDTGEMANQDVVSIFSSAVNSVLPHHLIRKHIQLDHNGKNLIIEDKKYKLDNNVYVVGFGKAVLGMARAVDDTLSQHIVKGIISVPTGIQENFSDAGKLDMLLDSNSKIEVREGSKNNMPDKSCNQTAVRIQDLVSKLREKDLLIVLISGGGSALLPLPIPPVTLEEELELTQILSKNGATIDELNILRKNIEVLKGGGLAKQAFPAKVIALIVSDVIGDKLEIISSGPTVADKSTPQQCLMILKQLNLQDKIPESINTLLVRRTREITKSTGSVEYTGGTQWEHVHNVIVGNNKMALAAASMKAEQLGFLPIILSSVLDGEASKVGVMFGMLARYAALSFGYKVSNPKSSDYVQLELDLVSKGVPKKTLKKVVALAHHAYNIKKPICILTGGETTVQVKGSGKGGRNQEMVVACALEIDKQCQGDTSVLANFDLIFLSGGTDGIDGPTPVAGAVIDQTFIQKCNDNNMDALTYLRNNDTFNLFEKISEECLILIGHTGTNVMDIQALVIKSKK